MKPNADVKSFTFNLPFLPSFLQNLLSNANPISWKSKVTVQLVHTKSRFWNNNNSSQFQFITNNWQCLFAISSFLKALTFVAWSLLFWQSAFSYVFLSYFLKIQTDSQQQRVFLKNACFHDFFSCLKYFKRTFVETFFICVIHVDMKRNQVLTI